MSREGLACPPCLLLRCLLILLFSLSRQSPELLLNPVVIARSNEEKVLIEGSVNSVRVSVKIKKADDLDIVLARRFLRFLTQRAENFVILRRKAVEVRHSFEPRPPRPKNQPPVALTAPSLPFVPVPSL